MDGPKAASSNKSTHDTEWGVPVHDDRLLFEMLTLEGAQAGLSWRAVLVRRAEYHRAFAGFDLGKIAGMTDADLEALLANPGLIRNRLKIASVRDNARAALRLMEEAGSLDRYLWSFVDGAPVINRPSTRADVPATTDVSEAMSRALRRRGFRFVGPTICYALMQATGMVNDHLITCFRHPDQQRP